MFLSRAKGQANVPDLIVELEGKRDYQEQKSVDMLERAKEAAKAKRRDAAKSFLAQKATHDAAATQYSALIATLTQQQAIADLSKAHKEIATVIKTMKSSGDMTGLLDKAAETAEDVADTQSQMGSVLGGGLFSMNGDMDELLEEIMNETDTKPESVVTPSVEEEIESMPSIPTQVPGSSVPDLGAAFKNIITSPHGE